MVLPKLSSNPCHQVIDLAGATHDEDPTVDNVAEKQGSARLFAAFKKNFVAKGSSIISGGQLTSRQAVINTKQYQTVSVSGGNAVISSGRVS